MNNALIILCLTVSCFTDCGTVSYVSRLPDLQIRKSERRVTWIDTDYTKMEKNDKYLESIGFEYLNNIIRNRTVYGLYLNTDASLRERILSAGIERVFFKEQEVEITQHALTSRGSQGGGPLSIHAFKNDDYLDIGLSNSDAAKYFFLFIKVRNSGKWSGSIQYFEILVFKAKTKHLQYWTHPLFKTQSAEGQKAKDFHYPVKKEFPEYFDSSDRNEFMAETFVLVKKDIVAGKVKFKEVYDY